MHKQTKLLKFKTYFIVFLIILAVYLLVSILSLSYITIRISPKESVVLIDNAPVKINRQGTAKKIISVGNHKIDIQAEGHIGVSQAVKIRRFLPTKLEVSLSKVSESKIVSKGELISKGQSNSEFFYLGNQGKTLFKTIFVKSNGKTEMVDQAITGSVLANIEEIIWSDNKELALFRKRSGEITLFDFKKYDFVSQTENKWGEQIGSITWTPDGSKIAYCYTPENTLIFSDAAHTENTRILNFSDYNIEDPILRWSPDSANLLIIPRSKNQENNKIYSLNRYNLQITALTESGSQLDAKFSPDNQKILFLSYSKDPAGKTNSIVSIMDKDGNNKKSLDIRTDFNKIAWTGQNTLIICSIDQSGKEKLYYYDLASNSQMGGALTGLSSSPINLLAEVNNGKIIIYQSGENIYYLEIGS